MLTKLTWLSTPNCSAQDDCNGDATRRRSEQARASWQQPGDVTELAAHAELAAPSYA